MVEHLLQFIPVAKNVIERANERLSEGVVERLSNCLFRFFNDMEDGNRLANNDILKMINAKYSLQHNKNI